MDLKKLWQLVFAHGGSNQVLQNSNGNWQCVAGLFEEALGINWSLLQSTSVHDEPLFSYQANKYNNSDV